MGNFRTIRSRGFEITFENEASVSVYICPGSYSDNYNEVLNYQTDLLSNKSKTAQIEVRYEYHSVSPECYAQGIDVFKSDSVLGYVSTDDFVEILNRVRKMTPDELKKNLIGEE